MLSAPLVCRQPACLQEYVSVVCKVPRGELKRGILLITTTGACILNVEDRKLNICLDAVTTCAELKESICRYIFLSAFWCDDMVTSRLGISTSGDLPTARRFKIEDGRQLAND